MKFNKLLLLISSHKRHSLLTVLGILIVIIFVTPQLVHVVKANFGSWGDNSMINGCVNNRGAVTIVSPGDSCKSGETQVSWLKDIDVGAGLSIDRTSSNGAVLSLSSSNNNGWTAANETWTYASSDSPTYTFTVSGDDTGKYSPGMRIKLTQSSTIAYFLITGVSYSSPNTTVTVYGGTDYTLANSSISSPYYSMEKAPQGFPLDPSKWTVRVTSTNDGLQSAATVGTWYNPDTALNLTVPIGAWELRYMVHLWWNIQTSSATIFNLTASTSNNTQSDADLTSSHETDHLDVGRVLVSKEKYIKLTSKTTYYINVETQYGGGGTDSVGIVGDRNSTNIVEAVSAYL